MKIKINEELLENVAMNPTKESRTLSVLDLCQDIDKGMLALPLYQRDLSWTLQKCVDLLNYQLKGKSPVAAISVNLIHNIDNAVRQISFVGRDIIETRSGINSVIDGQQRITTNYKAYIDSEDFRNVVLDLSKGRFIIIDENKFPKKNQIPVGILLNKNREKLNEFIKSRSYDFDVQTVLMEVRQKFQGYYYTINQAKDLTEDEQIQWFEVLNNAGSKVTAIQMRFAKLKIDNIDVNSDYARLYVEKFEEHGLEGLFEQQNTHFSYPICALNPAYEKIMKIERASNCCPIASDVKQDNICKMSPSDIKDAFVRTLEGLDKAISFIEFNNLPLPSRIEYVNFLLGYFVFHPEEPTAEEVSYLKNWYESVDFGNTSNKRRRDIYSNLIEKK